MDRSDVLIVGAGIAGLAHAVAALERGLSVSVVERDALAVGASVRNFGHACVTGQTGDLLDLALASRAKWLEYGRRAGFRVAETGGLAVARSDAELAVLQELSGDRGDQVRMLISTEVGERLGGSADPAVIGGAALRDDLRVDPRTAVGALAGWLQQQPGVRILWRTSFLRVEDGTVRTSRGELYADRVIVCVGHDLDLLYPDVADAYEIERCALQMALVDAPDARAIVPAVLTGTSMLRYPAFAETAAADVLRTEMAARRSDLLGIGANVMFTQRPDGTLIVGDSHAYELTHPPFLDETTTDTLLAEVARVLGTPVPTVRQRWQGIYASSDRQPYVIAHPAPRLTIATISSGVGMTIALGLAERTFDGADVPAVATVR